MAKVGFRDCKLFKVTAENNGVLTYDHEHFYQIQQGRDFQYELNKIENSVTGYDVIAESYTAYDGGNISIEYGLEDLKVTSAVRGCEYIEETKTVITRSTDKFPYFGVGVVETFETDGKTTFTSYFIPKVKFKLPEANANTREDAIEFLSYTLEGTSVAIIKDGVQISGWQHSEFQDPNVAIAWNLGMAGAVQRINFDANGGQNAPNSQNFILGQQQNMPDGNNIVPPEVEGKIVKFIQWTWEKLEPGVKAAADQIVPGASIAIDTLEKTVYANWGLEDKDAA